MSSITGYKPVSGQVTSPRPTVEVTVNLDEYADTIQANYTLTQGSVSYTVSRGVNANAGTPGVYTIQIPVNQDLADGSWTLSVTAYRLLWPGHVPGSGPPTTLGTVSLGAGVPATQTFTSQGTATVTQLTPVANNLEPFSNTDPANPTSHNQLFTWQFGSNASTDYQSEATVEVRRADTLASVATQTLTTSNQYMNVPLPAAQTDVVLEWRVRAKNRYGTLSNYSAWSKFTYGTPPTTSIATPTANQVLSSGAINYTVSATTTGGRTIKKILAEVWQGSVKLWSKEYTGTFASGASTNLLDALTILPQTGSGEPYTLKVWHTDSGNLQSAGLTRNFTVSYTAVPAPSVTPVLVNTFYADSGYMRLRWGSESLDSGFYAWVIERQSAPLDPNTGVVDTTQWSAWTEVGRVYNLAISYEFRDYLAPANYNSNYRVRQAAIRDGQVVLGTATSTPVAADATTDSYWLMSGTSTGTMKQLTNLVTNPQTSNASSNNSSLWTSTTVSNITTHPKGFVNGKEVAPVNTFNTQIASVFNLDGLGASVGVARYVGTYIKCTRAATALLYIGGSQLATQATVAMAANTWYWIQTVAPAAGNSLLLVSTSSGNAVSTDRVYISGAVATTEAAPPGYFDGATAGAVWNGTANASTSTTYVADDSAVETSLTPIRLYNVTGDSFATEIQRNEFSLIGRGRYIENGDRLGVKGTLDCQLRDGQGLTARRKRLLIEAAANSSAVMEMRNPFGDIYSVSIGDVSVTRVPGTGKSEFVDIQIPYSEVA